MSKFDTHGGYFAPKDYMKVEAGGSHEENPNGGVQIGVDQEGTPNLLEEGEPVYKDYVYSDNIKASERFLKDNNIPEKYAGELYSKIADSFFSEAENRPYDPISRNGLEAMLGRLADAQEGQKAYNEQRQLERELKSLSPDELAALEEMLAAGEQQAMEQQVAPAEPMMPQEPEMIPQEVAPGPMPMMRNGGKLFKDGGDEDKVLSAQSVITEPAVITADDPKRLAMEAAVRGGINRFAEEYAVPAAGYLIDPGFGVAMAAIDSARQLKNSGEADNTLGELSATGNLFRFSSDPEYIIEQAQKTGKKKAAGNKAMEEYEAFKKAKGEAYEKAAGEVAKAREEIKKAKTGYDTARQALEEAAASGADSETLKRLSDTYIEKSGAISKARKEAAKATIDAAGKGLSKTATVAKKLSAVSKAPGFIPKAIGVLGTGALIGSSIYDSVQSKRNGNTKAAGLQDSQVNSAGTQIKDYHVDALGGPINRFVDGGDKDKWDYSISRIMRTPPVLNPSYVTADAPSLYDSVPSVTVTDTKKAMPSFSTAASQMYPLGLRRSYSPISFDELARRTYGTYTSPDMDSYYGPTYEWQYREDHPVWAEELEPAVITADKPSKPAINGVASLYSRMSPTLDKVLSNVDLSGIGNKSAGTASNGTTTTDTTSTEDGAAKARARNPYLSTFPRYAGAIGSGLLGLYNAFQKPDEYAATRYKPFTPSGRISLQDQVYNPVDQNMMMNQVLAQGNSAQRALRNSGLGPSTAAAMVAQDNNITGNLGNTFLQTWDANNQRRNQVIAANNQNEAQRAQFDYAVDVARQRALADAQMRNAYTDLQIQQLNNAAEGEKYAAVSNQISNALQALSGIGQENFAMNQVNSNTANEGYGVLGGGIAAYLPYIYQQLLKEQKESNTSGCGGHIQRKKK